MAAPISVKHRACSAWLLQHSDAGPAGKPYWIIDLDRCEATARCPGCGADLQDLHAAGELVAFHGTPAAPPAQGIEDLDLKLQVLQRLEPILAPDLTLVLRGISADLQQRAAA